VIRLQLGEAALACCYKCITGTVFERLVQQPSATVIEAIALPTFAAGKVIPHWKDHTKTLTVVEWLKEIPPESIICLGTWNTLYIYLQGLKKRSTFLQHHLCELPPEDGFVKANRWETAFGKKYKGFKDAIETPPQVGELNAVIAVLKDLLSQLEQLQESSDEDEIQEIYQKIIKALEPLQGDNYSHYVEPPLEELADGAKSLLLGQLGSTPEGGVIPIEHWSIDALKKHHKDWLDGVLDWNSCVKVVPGGRLQFCNSFEGHRVIITPSYFIAFAEKVSKNINLTMSRSFLFSYTFFNRVEILTNRF